MGERGLTAGRIVIIAVGVAAVFGLGALVGYAARGEPEHTATERLAASQIGNAAEGRRLFSDYKCSACHSYQGVGGKDAPPLDDMRGRMTARDVANMSGRIWNHLPQMVKFFREEGIEVPMFSGSQMSDLVAYLHGGGPAPEMPEEGHMDEDAHGENEEEGRHMDEDEGGGKKKKGGV